jgi:hypothetical protein
MKNETVLTVFIGAPDKPLETVSGSFGEARFTGLKPRC